jgi:stage III sporulation protein SpoIIIAA
MAAEVKSEGGFVLPTVKVPAVCLSPKSLIIFSKPKVGKTTLLSQLNNCLIIDQN